MAVYAGYAGVTTTGGTGQFSHACDARTAGTPLLAGDQPFELAAGASITVKSNFKSAGTAIPNAGDLKVWVGFYEDDSTALVQETKVLDLAGGWTTGDTKAGTDVTFSPSRAGTYRIRCRMEYAQVTADTVNGGYIATSDGAYTKTGTPNTWDAGTASNKGYLRAGVTLSAIAVSNTLGGTTPSPFAWPDSVRVRITASAQALANSSTFTINDSTQNTGGTPVRTFSTVASSSSTTWDDSSAPALDKTDPTSFGVKIGAPANSTLSSRPWLHFEAAPTGWTLGANDGGAQATKAVSASTTGFSWDGRITIIHLLQLNDSAYGTPPLSKDVASAQRMTADLGFLSFRCTNARGEGQSSITCSEQIKDAKNLLASFPSRSGVVTSTQGGEAGWAPSLLTWDNQLPGGNWTHTVTITAPSGVTGQEVANTKSYTLLAINPNIKTVVYVGPSTLAGETDHLHPGDTLRLSVSLVDTSTLKRIAPDAAPSTVLLRYRADTNTFEFLGADGSTWTTWSSGVAAASFTLTQDPTDTLRFGKDFGATTSWGATDIVAAIVNAKVNGTPYVFFSAREMVDTANSHSGYALDGLALATAGVLSLK